MGHKFAETAFTPDVQRVQEKMRSRRGYARMLEGDAHHDRLGPSEAEFIGDRDSFYIASVGETGWPYIQHRGGPKGFVVALDPHTLAFADLRGNRQYISVGNVAEDERVALIFVDYPNRARLKVLARATVLTREQAPEVFDRVAAPASAEAVFLLKVEGFDWNCPKHITPRFTEEQIHAAVQPLRDELSDLRRQNAELRAALEQRRA